MSSERGAAAIRCACGARLRVPAGAAGRSIRCPKCGQKTRAPADGGDAASAVAAESAARTAPRVDGDGRVHFRCRCGKKLALPLAAAGRRAKCPQCAAVVVVPDPSAAPPAGAPPGEDADFLLTALSDGVPAPDPGPRPAPPRPPSPPDDDDGLLGIAPLVDTPIVRVPEVIPGQPKVCPSCKRELPGTAKICVECGVDLKTGRPLVTTQDDHLDHIYMNVEGLLRYLSWIFWTGLLPIASEAFGLRKPWVTRGLALLTILISAWYMVEFLYNRNPDPALGNLMLWGGSEAELQRVLATAIEEESLSEQEARELRAGIGAYRGYQLITHAFLHADPLHLIGNLIFMLVFGSRVNALIGNTLTLLLYPLLGVLAGLAQMAAIADEPLAPMLGASGAVMGLAGMYLVFFPTHKVHMVFWWRWGLLGRFQLNLNLFAVRGFWVVLFYIGFDVLYTVLQAEDGVAHWAHLGGFLAGAALALLLLVSRLVNARGGDVLSAIFKHHAFKLIGKPNRKELPLW